MGWEHIFILVDFFFLSRSIANSMYGYHSRYDLKVVRKMKLWGENISSL